MKKASLISFVLLLIMAGQAVGDDWWWPPTAGAMVTPQPPKALMNQPGQWLNIHEIS